MCISSLVAPLNILNGCVPCPALTSSACDRGTSPGLAPCASEDGPWGGGDGSRRGHPAWDRGCQPWPTVSPAQPSVSPVLGWGCWEETIPGLAGGRCWEAGSRGDGDSGGWGMRSRHFQHRLFSGHGLTWVFSFASSGQTPVQDSVSHFQSKDSYSHRHNRFSPLTVLNHHYLQVSTVLLGVEAKRQSCLPVIRAEPAQTDPSASRERCLS